MQATTLSGQLVSNVVVGRGVPLNAWQHVPEPLYRIAEDGNLYTRQEFEHFYGQKAYDQWTFAPPCYEHVIDVINGAGELAHLSALDFLHRKTKSTFSLSQRAQNTMFGPSVQDERAQKCSD